MSLRSTIHLAAPATPIRALLLLRPSALHLRTLYTSRSAPSSLDNHTHDNIKETITGMKLSLGLDQPPVLDNDADLDLEDDPTLARRVSFVKQTTQDLRLTETKSVRYSSTAWSPSSSSSAKPASAPSSQDLLANTAIAIQKLKLENPSLEGNTFEDDVSFSVHREVDNGKFAPPAAATDKDSNGMKNMARAVSDELRSR